MDENNKKKRKINKKKKKRSEAWEKVMSSFTDDLWIEIFLRLPFKSLLRSKSVSKSWLCIISSHRFAKSYLDTGATNDDEIFIVHNEFGDNEEEDGSFSLFHLGLGNNFKNLQFPYSQGEYPFEAVTSELLGSDCGIVCVSVDISRWCAAKKKYDIYLWNPATKHSKLIPPYTLPDYDCHWTSGTLGFGFDHIDLDFKVVRVVSSTLRAEVYSSNSNVWRKIESKPIDTPNTGGFHVFHGFLLAIGHSNTMMAFNLNREVFVCGIKLPAGYFDDEENSIVITDFKDTIAVTITLVKEGKINLWTLDDETSVRSSGVEASWTKVLTVDLGVPFEFLVILFSNSQFLLFEKDGDQFCYNWKNNVTTDIPINHLLVRDEYFKYTSSLFSLVGFKRIKWAASSLRLQDSSDSDE